MCFGPAQLIDRHTKPMELLARQYLRVVRCGRRQVEYDRVISFTKEGLVVAQGDELEEFEVRPLLLRGACFSVYWRLQGGDGEPPRAGAPGSAFLESFRLWAELGFDFRRRSGYFEPLDYIMRYRLSPTCGRAGEWRGCINFLLAQGPLPDCKREEGLLFSRVVDMKVIAALLRSKRLPAVLWRLVKGALMGGERVGVKRVKQVEAKPVEVKRVGVEHKGLMYFYE